MARGRRQSRMSKGWLYADGTMTLTGDSNFTTISNGDVVNYGQIDSDENVVNERSEYAIRRAIIWYTVRAVGTGVFITSDAFDCRMRLGVIDRDVWDAQQDLGVFDAPDYGADLWDRILWERNLAVPTTNPLGFEADSTVVTGAGPATRLAYPTPFPNYELDIQPNCRLRDTTSLSFMLGTEFPSDDIEFVFRWSAKLLLTKRL